MHGERVQGVRWKQAAYAHLSCFVTISRACSTCKHSPHGGHTRRAACDMLPPLGGWLSLSRSMQGFLLWTYSGRSSYFSQATRTQPSESRATSRNATCSSTSQRCLLPHALCPVTVACVAVHHQGPRTSGAPVWYRRGRTKSAFDMRKVAKAWRTRGFPLFS